MSFKPPRYNYGGSGGRYVMAQVVNRKDDPEQAGRCQVRIIGYQNNEGLIPKEDLLWARPAFGLGGMHPQQGGVGGATTGLLEGSVVLCTFLDADEQNIQMHSTIGASADENGNFTKADAPPHTRDEKHGGGDKRWDAKANNYSSESITEYARNEATNAYGQKNSKDSEGWTMGVFEYKNV